MRQPLHFSPLNPAVEYPDETGLGQAFLKCEVSSYSPTLPEEIRAVFANFEHLPPIIYTDSGFDFIVAKSTRYAIPGVQNTRLDLNRCRSIREANGVTVIFDRSDTSDYPPTNDEKSYLITTIASFADERRRDAEEDIVPSPHKTVAEALRLLNLVPEEIVLPNVEHIGDGSIIFTWGDGRTAGGFRLIGDGETSFYLRDARGGRRRERIALSDGEKLLTAMHALSDACSEVME